MVNNLPISPLSPEEQQKLLGQMYLLMGKQVESYHKHRRMGSNTSISQELARELMESLEYTLNLAGGPGGDLEKTLRLGREILANKTQQAKKLLALVHATAPDWQTVCRWENGSRCPDIVMCKKISMVLDVALDELISEETVSEYVPEKESSLDISCVKVMLTGILLLILATFLYVVYDGESNSFVYCFVLGLAIFVIGLFIPWEKRKAVQEDQLPQRTCPQCGKNHDFDYPQFPYCGNRYVT
jgi:hypothetical protein